MNTPQSPAATGQTRLNNANGLTTVEVQPSRKITYIFKITSASNVNLPYAVAVNGTVLPAYASRTARVSGSSGKISLTVRQGQRVTLYLNSDASPDFRSQPVYAIVAGARDATITITEKVGKHADSDTPILQTTTTSTKEDVYLAPLTGDIWMKVSHKYTQAEVDARVPANTRAEVLAAVKSIYAGLPSSTLKVHRPERDGQSARTLTVQFADSNNPKDNISAYGLLADGLPRVHPAGFAALFTAALENDISSMSMSSCWRPMLGSIAHRAGLGLDVSVLGGTKLNRQELRQAVGKESAKPAPKGNANDNDTVSEAEIKAFSEYEKVIKEEKEASAKLKAADDALIAANKSKDPEKIADAQRKQSEASDTHKNSLKNRDAKKKSWNTERDKNEKSHVRAFRLSLLQYAEVRQLFDPWFMESNTKDKVAPTSNMQITSNETLHAHHLHITINEPNIL